MALIDWPRTYMETMRMLMRWMAAAVLGVAMGGGVVAEAQANAVPAKDAAEINASLKGMQDAWNAHDMKAFVSYMADDVEWVNVVGHWWRGKAQVYKAHERLHETMFKNRALHDATEVELRQVAPGVVVATSVIPADGYTTADGRQFPPDRNVLTEVFVRREGKWLVVEGHNTTIDERAAAHDPGK